MLRDSGAAQAHRGKAVVHYRLSCEVVPLADGTALYYAYHIKGVVVRYGSDHKSGTRTRIVKAAAREVRIKGLDQMSVAAVMADVGLTHGGFYAHFASKDALLTEAIDTAFVEARARTSALDEAQGHTPDALADFAAYLRTYLSPEHRDRPERGCPVPTLSTDIARTAGTAQVHFARGVESLFSRIEIAMTLLRRPDPGAEAHAVIAQMVGAITLSRAVGTGPRSDRILSDNLTSLLTRLGL